MRSHILLGHLLVVASSFAFGSLPEHLADFKPLALPPNYYSNQQHNQPIGHKIIRKHQPERQVIDYKLQNNIKPTTTTTSDRPNVPPNHRMFVDESSLPAGGGVLKQTPPSGESEPSIEFGDSIHTSGIEEIFNQLNGIESGSDVGEQHSIGKQIKYNNDNTAAYNSEGRATFLQLDQEQQQDKRQSSSRLEITTAPNAKTTTNFVSHARWPYAQPAELGEDNDRFPLSAGAKSQEDEFRLASPIHLVHEENLNLGQSEQQQQPAQHQQERHKQQLSRQLQNVHGDDNSGTRKINSSTNALVHYDDDDDANNDSGSSTSNNNNNTSDNDELLLPSSLGGANSTSLSGSLGIAMEPMEATTNVRDNSHSNDSTDGHLRKQSRNDYSDQFKVKSSSGGGDNDIDVELGELASRRSLGEAQRALDENLALQSKLADLLARLKRKSAGPMQQSASSQGEAHNLLTLRQSSELMRGIVPKNNLVRHPITRSFSLLSGTGSGGGQYSYQLPSAPTFVDAPRAFELTTTTTSTSTSTTTTSTPAPDSIYSPPLPVEFPVPPNPKIGNINREDLQDDRWRLKNLASYLTRSPNSEKIVGKLPQNAADRQSSGGPQLSQQQLGDWLRYYQQQKSINPTYDDVDSFEEWRKRLLAMGSMEGAPSALPGSSDYYLAMSSPLNNGDSMDTNSEADVDLDDGGVSEEDFNQMSLSGPQQRPPNARYRPPRPLARPRTELRKPSGSSSSGNHRNPNQRRPPAPLAPAGNVAASALPLEFGGKSQASSQQRHRATSGGGGRHLSASSYQQQQQQQQAAVPFESLMNQQHADHHDSGEEEEDAEQQQHHHNYNYNPNHKGNHNYNFNHNLHNHQDRYQDAYGRDNLLLVPSGSSSRYQQQQLLPSASHQVVHIHHKEKEASYKKGKYLWPIVGGGLTMLMGFLIISNLLLSIPLLAIGASSLFNSGGYQQQQLVPVYNLSQLVTTRAPSGRRRRRRRRDVGGAWHRPLGLIGASSRGGGPGAPLISGAELIIDDHDNNNNDYNYHLLEMLSGNEFEMTESQSPSEWLDLAAEAPSSASSSSTASSTSAHSSDRGKVRPKRHLAPQQNATTTSPSDNNNSNSNHKPKQQRLEQLARVERFIDKLVASARSGELLAWRGWRQLGSRALGLGSWLGFGPRRQQVLKAAYCHGAIRIRQRQQALHLQQVAAAASGLVPIG